MVTEKRLMRDCGLKPRKTGDLPKEKLEQILGRIYPLEIVNDLMEKLCCVEEGEEDVKSCDD